MASEIIKKFDIPCATNFLTQLKLPNFSEEVIVNVSEDFLKDGEQLISLRTLLGV